MITGREPFRGEDEHSRTYAILNQDPEPLTALRAGVPLGLEPVLAKALAKDPERRYQHVDELPVDLTSALTARTGAIPGATGSPGPKGARGRSGLLLAGAVLGALLTYVGLGGRGQPTTAPPVHLSVALPPDLELVETFFRRFALSPDGRVLVYAARKDGREQLYLRPLDRAESRPIPGTASARDPFFSPDGRWVGFFAGEELRKVPLDGGAPLKICDAPTATSRGASWGPDGAIILPLGQLSGLFRVSDSGGTPEPLTVPRGDSGSSGHFSPQILPDGGKVLFTVWNGSGWSTAILTLGTGDWEEIASGCTAARYLATGHVICAEMEGVRPTGTLLAAPFDPEHPAPVPSFVSLPGSSTLGEFDFAASQTGTLVYATAETGPGTTAAVWVDRGGRSTRPEGSVAGYQTPSLSPDGRLAVTTRIVEAGREEVWLHDLESGTAAQLSAASVIDNLPIWSPDGDRILFNSVRSPPGLYQGSPNLSDTSVLLLPRGQHILVPGSFSAGGRFLAYTELNNRTLGDVWMLSLDDGAVTPLLRSPANERTPVFSPDGRWLAFASDESGTDQVYVRAYPGPGPPMRISSDGGSEPVWSRDGTELFYRHGGTMMAAPVRTEGAFAAGRPIPLFEDRYATEYKGRPNYDVGPDGRFLMVEVEKGSEGARLEVVLNWFDELARLVPVAGSGN
jgi:serine/threonine-protein kinase